MSNQCCTLRIPCKTVVSFPDDFSEKYVWWSAYSILVLVRRNVGALFYFNLTRDVTQPHSEIPQCVNRLSRTTWMSTRQFELLVWASLCVPTGRGKSLCYAILSYVQTNSDLRNCFLHLRFESNSAIEQDEASLVHIARRNALSWDSFTASRVGKTTSTKTYTYTDFEHDNIKLAFRLRDAK